MRLAALLLALAASPLFASPPPAAPTAASAPISAGQWVHAYSAFGEPKYPRGFDHFEYVNPVAPKGGTLYLANPDRRTAFDKFNPFTIRGSSPAGVELFMLEPLAVFSADEPMTMYGLLAEEMMIAPDKSAMLSALGLGADEKRALVAFLRALDGASLPALSSNSRPLSSP